MIIGHFGSDVNGLLNSVTNFLGVISFLELGVGAVVQSALYKPLANNNEDEVSRIIASANRFFTRIGQILIVYVVILVFIYPKFIGRGFESIYTSTLIITISISSFAQYYLGIVNRLLLTADQKGYIQYNTQTLAVIGNTLACYVLIFLGCNIHIVKLTTSLIYLLQPFVVNLYVRKHYRINKKIKYTQEPIPQKWNGIAQHIAAVVLDGTDAIVLSIFATFADVSIYTVYHLVVKGVKQLFLSMTNGIAALIGELWAKQKLKELNDTFAWTEWIIHTGTTLIFGLTAVLIVPFVEVYTFGVEDAMYIQPAFALLIVAANAGHCLRIPYNMLILAAGRYKQTQANYIIAALINIVINILTVKAWGLVGIAIGTLISMCYQTIWMAIYDSKHLIKWPLRTFVKQISVDLLTVVLGYGTTFLFRMPSPTYFHWVLLAIKSASVWLVLVVAINLVFYRRKMIDLYMNCKAKLLRR